MVRRTCVRALVLALLGAWVAASGVSAVDLVFRVERVTGDVWAKGWIETDRGFRFPDGTTMTTAAVGNGNGWSLTGNAGTDSATQFLGTTDSQALVLRTNNVERVRVMATGKVGIGAAEPGSPLTVAGMIESTSGGIKFPDGTVQLTAAAAGPAAWSLSGNTGTNPATNFLGTTDSQALVLRTNNVERVRVMATGNVGIGTAEPGSPLTVAGMIESTSGGFKFPDGSVQFEAATAGPAAWSLSGNTGTNPATNFLGTTDDVAFEIRVNNVRALRIEPHATSPNIIGGYHGNTVGSGVTGATISGGGSSGSINQVTANFGTVAGGMVNMASRTYATVSGGLGNMASGTLATVSGGMVNMASGTYATVSGGSSNTASGDYATVGGGSGNTASGGLATVGGGSGNTAAGDHSFVVGHRAKNDDEEHKGVFMFADSTDANFLSAAPNEFAVRASGGYRLFSNADADMGVILAAEGNTWSSVSDRNVKANFAGVDTVQLLDALAGMPVSTWNLQAQSEEVRHIGPVAQDFNASFAYLFGEVESPLHINTMDAVGVSLAASQGLYTLVQEQAEQIAQQAGEIEDLRARLEALEKLVQGGA